MRNDVAGAIVGFVLVALMTFFGLRAYQGAVQRTDMAQAWSNDNFHFTATGDRSTVFVVEPLGYDTASSHVACGLFVSEVVNDAKLSRELGDAGFKYIRCDGIKTSLTPDR